MDDIGAMLARLSENPAALNMLGSLLNGMGAGASPGQENTQNSQTERFAQNGGFAQTDRFDNPYSQAPEFTPRYGGNQNVGQGGGNPGGGLDINALLGLLGGLGGGANPGGAGNRGTQGPQGSQNNQSIPAGNMNAANNIGESGGQAKKNSGIFGTKEDIKNRIALLGAVKPYLSQSRRDMLENIIKLLRLTELGELGSLLGRM